MAKKNSSVVLGRSSTVKVDEAWLDGDVWELEPVDYAPNTPEVARQLIRGKIQSKFGKKIATKIDGTSLFIQVIPEDELVVEADAGKLDGDGKPAK
jgi:hypothetical protein